MADKDSNDEKPQIPNGMRMGGGGKLIPADSPVDTSMEGEDASTIAAHATAPTEGPAAPGALPG
jgi:hypothetical protein